MENTTFATPSIIDSHDMELRTVLLSRCPKRNAYLLVNETPFNSAEDLLHALGDDCWGSPGYAGYFR
ncbi:hypothetical protein TNCV_1767381 [Trichonephila clavipes]|nr:hypothetical protein TNCV_1767381 [Trichonephila clavipes]